MITFLFTTAIIIFVISIIIGLLSSDEIFIPIVGFLLCLFYLIIGISVASEDKEESYKQGQIDYINGIIKYKQEIKLDTIYKELK